MKTHKETIRKIIGYLNNPDEDGGFWLPNIQRPFVWSEEQICRLFDSILREYPISTLLIWKTTSGIRRRKFIDNWRSTLKLSAFFVPEDNKKKCLVLDGQQRLQSLYIGLRGSFEGKELYFDILSGTVALPDDIKYKFEFRNPGESKFPWVKFKDLVFTTIKKRDFINDFRAQNNGILSQDNEDRIEENIDLIDRTFKMEESVTYQELDSIDNPDLYTEDDVVEVFIRANSGGTKLEKSDLLFSLLNATWEVADDKMESLLNDLNRHGFAFDRDFVLKTCLVLLEQGAKYEVSKFRKHGVREDIEKHWESLTNSIRAVVDFIRQKTYIQCDKALSSYLALIPLIYVHYHFQEEWKKAVDVDSFLVRTLLSGAFGGQSDRILDALVKKFRESKSFEAKEGFNIISEQKRSLKINEKSFFEMGYGSKTKNLHLLFNLWYPTFSHVPAYENNLPQIDHIFPQSRLSNIKTINPQTGRQVMKYSSSERNQLANCMLLTREENGAGGKGDTLPSEWFKNKPDEYLDLHLIPKDKNLWAIEKYDEFIMARKILIKNKFSWLLEDVLSSDSYS